MRLRLTNYRIIEKKARIGFHERTYSFLQFRDSWKLFWFINTPLKVWRYIPNDFRIGIFKKYQCPVTFSGSMFDFYRVGANNLQYQYYHRYLLKEFCRDYPFIELYLANLEKQKKKEEAAKVEYIP